MEVPEERAVLVGAPTPDVAPDEADEHLEELGRLTDTAGAFVVAVLIQRLDAPHPRYFIGEGKAKQLKGVVKDRNASVVIFDDELSPAQGKNLEDLLEIRVLDRTELILDIFATRARTNEAQLQVELAQLEYLLPRLKRMWTHLSRIRGGIGLRGPGETQLETDRRIISRRISDLRDKLEVVARRRATQRKGRRGEFQAALVGYTNAGKSSLLRSLSGSELFIEDRLFATLDPATRKVELPMGSTVLITDTVGFIRKLPHHLVASFRATLEEAAEADVLLHVIDGSHPRWKEQKRVVEEVLTELDLGEVPVALVVNKVDQLTHDEEQALRSRAAAAFPEPAVFTSTIERAGLDELVGMLEEQVRQQRPEVRVLIPAADGETLATVYREGEVLSREERGTTIDLKARLPQPTLGRLRQREGVRVEGAA
ncbi:MAG TPA: GTPase HflX [Longimicrobiales bacterium]|nr:GTPase HflX [Longimicrobiales bacterium]